MWLFGNSNILLKDTELFQGFNDFHCHLLPGVDDGVQKLNETLEILDTWEKVGVSTVWLTPHIMEDIPNNPENLKKAFEKLKSQYTGQIQLRLSAENMMDNLFSKRLEGGRVLPLGNDASTLLVETSYFNPPYDMDEIIGNVMSKGFYPVLAHPERYNYMNIGDYKKLKDRRVIFQLNVPSLVGAYGEEVKKKAEMLLDKGFYELCGTDTHSIGFVKYYLNSKISKKTLKDLLPLVEKSNSQFK